MSAVTSRRCLRTLLPRRNCTHLREQTRAAIRAHLAVLRIHQLEAA